MSKTFNTPSLSFTDIKVGDKVRMVDDNDPGCVWHVRVLSKNNKGQFIEGNLAYWEKGKWECLPEKGFLWMMPGARTWTRIRMMPGV